MKRQLTAIVIAGALAASANPLEGQARKLFGVTGGATYTNFSSSSGSLLCIASQVPRSVRV